MRILTLITARSGSKRLPGKNIRLLGEKPLIVWSIDVVREIPEICDILVSTDGSEIAKIARSSGALVPWLRPANLSTDTVSSVDVCLHALDWYESEKGGVDGLLLLQPTSPLRRRKTILQGLEIFNFNGRRPVVGVSPAKSHPMMCFQTVGDVLRPFVSEKAIHRRYQDLPLAYVLNGAFYLIKPEDLRKQQSFYSHDMMPLIMDHQDEGIDIDTEADWKMAELALQSSTLNLK